MTENRIDRAAVVRRTAVRGLRPMTVFLIAAMVMVSGFAVSAVEVSEPETETAVAEVTEATRRSVRMTSKEERRQLLSDEDALYRATMWLARCVYSESHKRREQELVAWVVRNRVETRYRGKSTYRSVVTDPYQFSAFNRNSITRDFLVTVDSTYEERGWRQAVAIARKVIHANAAERPFPVTVRHFYSERSLGDREAPEWALKSQQLDLEPLEIDEKRFRFFDDVS